MSKITSLGRLEARFLVINDFAKFIEHPVILWFGRHLVFEISFETFQVFASLDLSAIAAFNNAFKSLSL